jgi:hypothetical protein
VIPRVDILDYVQKHDQESHFPAEIVTASPAKRHICRLEREHSAEANRGVEAAREMNQVVRLHGTGAVSIRRWGQGH